MPRSIASAPRKISLFGECVDHYGVTSIAAALSDLRIVVDVDVTSEPHISIELINFQHLGDDSRVHRVTHEMLKDCLPVRPDPLSAAIPSPQTAQAVKSACFGFAEKIVPLCAAACYLSAYIAPECLWGAGDAAGPRRGLKLTARAVGLPADEGLGCSAAFSVATAAALLRLRQLMFGDLLGGDSASATLADLTADAEAWTPPDDVLHLINAWAFAAEVIINGDPSGLDNTSSCFGGIVRLSRNVGRFETLRSLPPSVKVLLVQMRPPPPPAALVKRFREMFPNVARSVLESCEAVSQEFLQALDSLSSSSPERGSLHNGTKLRQFVQKTAILCETGHALLGSLGGESEDPRLEMLCDAARLGGFSGRLTCEARGRYATLLLPVDAYLTPLSPLAGQGAYDAGQTDAARNDPTSGDVLQLRTKFTQMGCASAQSALAGDGVLWHNEYPSVPQLDDFSASQEESHSSPVFIVEEKKIKTKAMFISGMLIDLGAAAAAVSVLYRIDQTFDPYGVLQPSECAVLALAAFGLGLAFRGIGARALNTLFGF